MLSAQIKLMKHNPLKCPGYRFVAIPHEEAKEGEVLWAGMGGGLPHLHPELQDSQTEVVNPLIRHIFDSQLIGVRRE